MSDAFDAYHQWLGIPPADQPPHLYRLLGIPLFEESPAVIEHAADQRMAHLRTFQTGKHSAESQRLLSEVAAARTTLLAPQKRVAYDEHLRCQLLPAAPPVVAGQGSEYPRTRSVGDGGKKQPAVALYLVAGAAVALVGVGIALWSRSSSTDRVANQPEPSEAVTSAPLLASARKPELLLEWPAEERVDGRLELDDSPLDWLTLVDPAGGDLLRLAVEPGDRHLRIVRPGFRPFEEVIAVSADKDVRVRPTWLAATDAPLSAGEEPVPVIPSATDGTAGPEMTDGVEEAEGAADAVALDPAAEPSAADEPATDAAVIAEAAPRQPVPPMAAQQAVFSQIETAYGSIADLKPEQRLPTVNELVALAEKSAEPVERFVLLRRAAELAAAAHEPALMLELVERIAGEFELDRLLAQQKLLVREAGEAITAEQITVLFESSHQVIGEALADERIDLAHELSGAVLKACQKTAGKPHRVTAFDRHRTLEKLLAEWEEVKKARAALQADPDDAAAHAQLGRWHGLTWNDWDAALPHLARGDDAELRPLAQRELDSPPATPEEQTDLADAWWDQAEKTEGDARSALQLHAGTWYQEAEPQLTSPLVKKKVAQRLEEIADLGKPIAAPRSNTPPLAIAPFDARQAKEHQQRWARHLNVAVEMTNPLGMKFVLIPPGEFEMGSTSDDAARVVEEARARSEPQWYIETLTDEVPRHRVRITKAFYLGMVEVTQSQYALVMGQDPGKLQSSANHPVEEVPWDGAQDFCRRLSEKLGRTYRLPTEAEWEYACRAGTITAWSYGGKQEQSRDFAWTKENSADQAHPVGQMRPNPWSLFDMHGNMWEWCSDRFDAAYYSRSPLEDPTGSGFGDDRIQRGGSWNLRAQGTRSPYRGRVSPARVYRDDGFRVLAEIPQPPPSVAAHSREELISELARFGLSASARNRTGPRLSRAAAALLNRELLINGHCEQPLQGASGGGWTAVSGHWAARTDKPAADGRGFVYPGECSTGELRQVVLLGAVAHAIDLGELACNFSGFIQAYDQRPPDSGEFGLQFLDATGNVLDSWTSARLACVGKWEKVEHTAAIPAQTRAILVRLVAYRTGPRGSRSNDVYFDNLSLTITANTDSRTNP